MMLVLRVLKTQPLHGYAIAQRIARFSNDELSVEEGSLYPALYRMENRGWIKASWALTENGRKAKYYKLTATGRRQLVLETQSWDQLTGAIGKIMSTQSDLA